MALRTNRWIGRSPRRGCKCDLSLLIGCCAPIGRNREQDCVLAAVTSFHCVVSVVDRHGEAVPQWASLSSCRLRCLDAYDVRMLRDVPLFEFHRSSCVALRVWFVEWEYLIYLHKLVCV